MRKKIISAIIFQCMLVSGLFPSELKIGDMARFFSVRSGDEKYLTLDDLKGKVSIVFYESRDAVNKNKELKRDLNKFYDLQNGDIKQKVVKVAIIDCSEAFWPFTMIWEKKLVDYSREKCLTIYGDWEGEMRKTYGFHLGESNFLILDKLGKIEFFQIERVKKDQFENVKKLISKLVLQS